MQLQHLQDSINACSLLTKSRPKSPSLQHPTFTNSAQQALSDCFTCTPSHPTRCGFQIFQSEIGFLNAKGNSQRSQSSPTCLLNPNLATWFQHHHWAAPHSVHTSDLNCHLLLLRMPLVPVLYEAELFCLPLTQHYRSSIYRTKICYSA